MKPLNLTEKSGKLFFTLLFGATLLFLGLFTFSQAPAHADGDQTNYWLCNVAYNYKSGNYHWASTNGRNWYGDECWLRGVSLWINASAIGGDPSGIPPHGCSGQQVAVDNADSETAWVSYNTSNTNVCSAHWASGDMGPVNQAMEFK